MPTSSPALSRAVWLGVLVTGVLLLMGFGAPHWLDWEVASRAPRSTVAHEVPPLHGYWKPQWFGPGTVPALLIGLLGWRYAAGLAERLSWRRLLVASYVASLGWLLSLALVDGTSGLTRAVGSRYEYLPTARGVGDVHHLLQTYVDRIPYSAADNWPTHVAGHPPGTLLFFVGLVKLGLGGDLAAGVVVTVLAATTCVAVLVTLRALGAEEWARRAAPFVVLTPAAVFMAVSADALIGAVVAWGLACLALATRRLWWAVPAGLLLGASVLMSYGMPLAGLLALAVLVAGRSWRPLPVAAAAALAVVLGFAAAGFSWWDAYPVLRDRYYDGIAKDRPQSYWWYGDLACLVVSAGPLLLPGLAATAVRRVRVVTLLAGAAALAIALADASGMSKAEVERIWLPFVPWLTLSMTLLPERWRRWGLAAQVATALLVQHLLYTSW